MPISRNARQPGGSIVQNSARADDPAAGVARPARLALGNPPKLRARYLAILEGVGDTPRLGHDARRAGREIAEPARNRFGLARLRLGRRLGLGGQVEPCERGDEHDESGDENLLHRLITSIEQTPDIRAYTLLLAFVLGLLLAADSRAHDPAGHTAPPPAGIGEAAR